MAIPSTGAQKIFEEHDEHKLRVFYEKRMGAEVEVDILGDQWKGYVLRITGGNDKQGFPMKQGVLSNGEFRLINGSYVYAVDFPGTQQPTKLLAEIF